MPSLWVTTDELENDGSSPYAYEAAKTASFILWALSGRKYSGMRTLTEHYECPCFEPAIYPAAAWGQGSLFPATPYLVDGAVKNAVGCGCEGTVGGVHTRLRLRHRPVRSIQKVSKDGETVDPDSYQLINASMIQPAPGHSFDPCGADITYTYGIEPPTAGKRAARYLAQELAKGWAGDEDCALPDRVTSVSRQGVNYTFLDDQAFLDDMRTGIYSVDLFLKAVNPDNARKPARVFSPDLPRASHVTGNRAQPVGPYDIAIQPGSAAQWTANLDDINAEVLAQDDWEPVGQISSWNGATMLEFEPSRFTVADGEITIALTGSETGTITGDGSFDLYASSTLDGYTIIHLLTSSVRMV
jgi:hypothetical protein